MNARVAEDVKPHTSPQRYVRIARICTDCHRRHFSDPNWQCPEHPRKAVDQPNNTYFGEPTLKYDPEGSKPPSD